MHQLDRLARLGDAEAATGQGLRVDLGVEIGEAFGELDFLAVMQCAGQVGFDYMINSNWGVNVDLKPYVLAGGDEEHEDGTHTAKGLAHIGADLKSEVRPGMVGSRTPP